MANPTQTMGISTIGALFGYGFTTAGSPSVKPASFTLVERCNSIDGIDISVESIDASALEDTQTKYIPGRTDPGDSFNVTFNLTDDVKTELNTMITAYTALTGGRQMWVQVWLPDMTDSCYIVAAPPAAIPMPEISQNGLLTVALPFTIKDFKGWDTAVKPVLPNA